MFKTIFQTYEGVIIYRPQTGLNPASLAMKKAAVLGFDSLVAYTPDGRKYDYTRLLNRDYIPLIRAMAA